jgi:hypothetical protein
VNKFIGLSIDLLPFIRYTIRIESERNKIMKMMMKLLGAKYMVTSYTGTRYFWRLNTAIKAVKNSTSRDIVWTLNYKPAYTHNPVFTSAHADAANYNTNI